MDCRNDETKIGAIEKAIYILNTFSEKPYMYSAKELSDKLRFSKPTVHRILNILEKEYYVRRIDGVKYTIGHKAYQMGMIYANNTDIYLEIRRVIDEIASVTGEQVGYAVLEDVDVVSVYESQMQDSRIRYIAGAVYPVNSGCYGKVLMTFSHSEEDLRKIVPSLQLKQVSPGAIMSHEELLSEYLKICKNGFGESSDEYLDGTVGLGVPVFNRDGKLEGCIALGAIKSLNFEKKKAFYLEELQKGAAVLRNIFF